MKYILLFSILLCHIEIIVSQDLSNASINFPDKIVSSKHKMGFKKMKANGKTIKYPPKVKSDKVTFMGGIGTINYSTNLSPEILFKRKGYHLFIPTGSYIIFGFENEVCDIPNTDDIFITCTGFICGKHLIDSACISVSNNNKKYYKIGNVHSRQDASFDLKNAKIKKPIHYIKVEGLSASAYPYGYELVSVCGLKENNNSYQSEATELQKILIDSLKRKQKFAVFPDMFFEINDSRIKEDQKGNIDTISNKLKSVSYKKIIITGYTDASGDKEYNLKLSKDRASSLAIELENHGIESDLIEIKGLGEEKLLDGEDIYSSKNRRVEIEIIY